MEIDRHTLVAQAWKSSPEAAGIFRRHGVDPGVNCSVVRDNTTMEDAEEWCGLKDLDELLVELNTAVRSWGR